MNQKMILYVSLMLKEILIPCHYLEKMPMAIYITILFTEKIKQLIIQLRFLIYTKKNLFINRFLILNKRNYEIFLLILKKLRTLQNNNMEDHKGDISKCPFHNGTMNQPVAGKGTQNKD